MFYVYAVLSYLVLYPEPTLFVHTCRAGCWYVVCSCVPFPVLPIVPPDPTPLVRTVPLNILAYVLLPWCVWHVCKHIFRLLKEAANLRRQAAIQEGGDAGAIRPEMVADAQAKAEAAAGALAVGRMGQVRTHGSCGYGRKRN